MDKNIYEIEIHVKGNNFNKLIKRKYTEIKELFAILNFLNKLNISVKNIDLIHISFSAFNTKSNLNEINKLTIEILACKLFVNYFEYYGYRVLVYDKKEYPNRIFNIIISNDEVFKKEDSHIYSKTRDDYYKERSIQADP